MARKLSMMSPSNISVMDALLIGAGGFAVPKLTAAALGSSTDLATGSYAWAFDYRHQLGAAVGMLAGVGLGFWRGRSLGIATVALSAMYGVGSLIENWLGSLPAASPTVTPTALGRTQARFASQAASRMIPASAAVGALRARMAPRSLPVQGSGAALGQLLPVAGASALGRTQAREFSFSGPSRSDLGRNDVRRSR